jgi:MFS family permease
VISYPAGLLSDRLGRKGILLLSFLIFILAYIGFATTKNFRLVIALFIFYGLFQGIFRAVGKSLASDFVPAQLRASGIGWYSTAVGVFQLAASVIAGILWDRVSHTAVFYYGAGCAAAGSLALWWTTPAGASARGRAPRTGVPPA